MGEWIFSIDYNCLLFMLLAFLWLALLLLFLRTILDIISFIDHIKLPPPQRNRILIDLILELRELLYYNLSTHNTYPGAWQ